jgi:predicted phage terminase large subunit-like protein
MQAPTDVRQSAERFSSVAELDAEMARRHHLDFIEQTWQRPGDPFIVGRHSRAICERIDRAIVDYRAGRSTFLVVMVPFRHGKSDMVSRYLPPHFLGLFQDSEVMLATYAADLADDLSRFARRITGSDEYQRIFPDLHVAEDSSAVNRWGVQGRTGGMVAAGLGGSMTGRGYALGVVDDYLRNRAEAESRLARDRIWDSFTNDFLTRRAPVSITLVVATPWHVDDLIGRISKNMREDPKFPQFETLRFPAFDDAYPTGTLFPERMPLSWYEGHRATLGTYGTASLLQCQPQTRGGNLLKTDRVKIVEQIPEGLRFVRYWDPASTVKDVMKPDPDWTVGVKLAIRTIRNDEGLSVPQLVVEHVKRGRWEAPERERIQKQIAELDGPGVRIGIEAAGGYKDSYTRLKAVLSGIAQVEPTYPAKDKLVRADPLSPIFEAGNVLLVRGDWNQEYLDEIGDFPTGSHDDQVDATSGGYAMVAAPNYVGPL